jgi:hypothetical protein
VELAGVAADGVWFVLFMPASVNRGGPSAGSGPVAALCAKVGVPIGVIGVTCNFGSVLHKMRHSYLL